MKLYKVIQQFPRSRLEHIESACRDQLVRFDDRVKENARIAIAVGSRGISNIDTIVKEVIDYCSSRGARPFIVPAMGSHGGATAEGQAALLASYGIDEKRMGAPVRSSMKVVELPRGDNQTDVFIDKCAYDSEGAIVINRIKPHTDYHGDYESGLAKMLVIGLGKHKQALAIHSYGVFGLKRLIAPTASRILSSGAIIGGVALLENAYDETMEIHALRAEEILDREPELLKIATRNMPKLPVEDIDILIVDWIGKNLSGVGMDPNIIGRMAISGEPEPERPNIKAIVIDDLTSESHGNALGIGFAQATTEKLVKKIDYKVMYENVFTSTFLERAKVPVVAPNAKRAYEFALRSCGAAVLGKERIVRIKDTLHVDCAYVSQPIASELKTKSGVRVSDDSYELFDSNGSLNASLFTAA